MHTVTTRRVGDGNVVELLAEPETVGYIAVTSVVLELRPGGELVLKSEGGVRENIRGVVRRVVGEHREAFDLPEAHDRGEAVSVDGELRRIAAPSSSA